MKISSLTILQYVGIMVLVLVTTGIVFRIVEKQMSKTQISLIKNPSLPVQENTAIDTSNGMAARVRYR